MHTEASSVDVDEDENGVADEAVKIVDLVILREIIDTLHKDSGYIPSRTLTQRALLGHYSSCQMRRRKGFATSQQLQPCSVISV